MVKNVKSIFVVLMFGSFISFSFNEEKVFNEKLTCGESAPELVLHDATQNLNLQSGNNEYTLLSFWATYDATSRKRNAELSNMIGNKNAQVKMISVSFDQYRSIYDATIRQDKLNTENSFLEMEGENSAVFKSFNLKNGFKNYLLDNNGRIVAVNIDNEQLSAFLADKI